MNRIWVGVWVLVMLVCVFINFSERLNPIQKANASVGGPMPIELQVVDLYSICIIYINAIYDLSRNSMAYLIAITYQQQTASH